MRASLKPRLVVGAVLAVCFGLIFWSSEGTRVNYSSINGHATYDAASDPVMLLVSPCLIALYVWVQRLPVDPGRAFVTAGIWRRLWAFLADFFLSMFILSPWSGFIALLVEASHTGTFVWSVHRDTALPGDGALAAALVLPSILLVLFYFAWPQYRGRPSPGSLLLGTGIRQDSGKTPSFWLALGRVVLSYVAVCGCFISIPMALFNPEKRMWQDLACGTRVVQWTD